MKKFILVLLLGLLTDCYKVETVVVVSTNDIHSSIDNFPRLATLVDSLRTVYGRHRVLLLDGGDRWTGDPFVDLAEPPLYPIVELMNELGYDLAVLGNHEFDWGQPLLEERVGQMKFPVLGANVKGLDGIKEYEVLKRDGIRFAFVGLTTNFSPDHRPEGKAEHFEGLSFPDVFETAAEYAPLAEQVDCMVALTHIGFDRDVELAERVPIFDLVIGGDSHTLLDTLVSVGKTVITQAESRLRYATVTTIRSDNNQHARVSRSEVVRLDTIAPSPRFAELVAHIKDNPRLDAPMGELRSPMDEHGVDNLVTDAIRVYTGVDVALYHSGGVRLDTLAGAVSMADIFRIDPFLSEIYTLRMTAGQLKGLIMGTFNSNSKQGGSVDILPSGVSYVIETNEAGEAVDVVLTPSADLYSVAMPDYLFKNYDFDFQGTMTDTDYLVTSVLESYIGKHSPLTPDNRSRVIVEN